MFRLYIYLNGFFLSVNVWSHKFLFFYKMHFQEKRSYLPNMIKLDSFALFNRLNVSLSGSDHTLYLWGILLTNRYANVILSFGSRFLFMVSWVLFTRAVFFAKHIPQAYTSLKESWKTDESTDHFFCNCNTDRQHYFTHTRLFLDSRTLDF